MALANEQIIETIAALQQRLDTGKPGVVTAKPRIFFKQVEELFGGPQPLNLQVSPSGIGSIMLLEGSVLSALAMVLRPSRAFEFGTFLGYSSAMLVRNT